MWNSITLKRSLVQISKAKPSTGIRSLSQTAESFSAAPYWEASSETSLGSNSSSSSINNVDDLNNSSGLKSNGIIRFTMTPKPQQLSSTSRGYGTSFQFQPMDGATTTNNITNSLLNEEQHEFEQHENVVATAATAAAEQMTKQMESSYYYASFKAKGSHEETSN